MPFLQLFLFDKGRLFPFSFLQPPNQDLFFYALGEAISHVDQTKLYHQLPVVLVGTLQGPM